MGFFYIFDSINFRFNTSTILDINLLLSSDVLKLDDVIYGNCT